MSAEREDPDGLSDEERIAREADAAFSHLASSADLGQMSEAAGALHELHLSLQKAGFTNAESLVIIGVMLRGN